MFNILMNWEELKAYFTSAELAQSQLDTIQSKTSKRNVIRLQKPLVFLIFSTCCAGI
jgi:hypothetical protein